jgi:undecaprenyl-diphosphatase
MYGLTSNAFCGGGSISWQECPNSAQKVGKLSAWADWRKKWHSLRQRDMVSGAYPHCTFDTFVAIGRMANTWNCYLDLEKGCPAMVDLYYAVVLGVVEGLTEFIPVSSTGHLILAGHLLGFEGAKASTFEIFIQLGAILAVVVLYKERLLRLCSVQRSVGFSGRRGILLLGLTTLPALVLGALTHRFIKEYLFTPTTVALGLGIGGVGILVVERFLPRVKKSGLDALNPRDAVVIGLYQCLALWPGMSRSACTIVGAMAVGIERETAAQYSFLAAVPLMFAATLFDLYKTLPILQGSDVPMFGVGFAVSFIAAWMAIKYFLRFLSSHTLNLFGWYRIIVALSTLWILG